MIYVTDLEGNRLEVRDLKGALEQVEVLIYFEGQEEKEKSYWLHMHAQLKKHLERLN